MVVLFLRMHRTALLIVLAAACLAGGALAPQSRAAWHPGPEQYGTGKLRNVPIAMRDGTILRADVHYPTDRGTGRPAPGPFPVLVGETPYGKLFADVANDFADYSPYLVKRGYIQAVVDV